MSEILHFFRMMLGNKDASGPDGEELKGKPSCLKSEDW